MDIDRSLDFPSGPASRPVRFCGEKNEDKKYICFFSFRALNGGAKKLNKKKKVKRTIKLW